MAVVAWTRRCAVRSCGILVVSVVTGIPLSSGHYLRVLTLVSDAGLDWRDITPEQLEAYVSRSSLPKP